jgi:hypothetical protein
MIQSLKMNKNPFKVPSSLQKEKAVILKMSLNEKYIIKIKL